MFNVIDYNNIRGGRSTEIKDSFPDELFNVFIL